jgi:hypothetical protein
MTMKTIQVQLAITLDETAANSLAELLMPLIKQAMGLPASQFDQKRDARLRASQNAIFGGEKPPEEQSLLIDSKEAAKLLKVSAGSVTGKCFVDAVVSPSSKESYDAVKAKALWKG